MIRLPRRFVLLSRVGLVRAALEDFLTGRYTTVATHKDASLSATRYATRLMVNLFALSSFVLVAPAIANPTETETAKEKETIAEVKAAESKVAEAKIESSKSKKGAHGDGKGATWCTARTTIKAPPEVVWRAVHDERQNDPDIAYSKVLEQNDNQFKLEQKFTFIPFLGTSTCVTHQTEVPNQRIDYKLVKSDHFKAMEGSWVLSPSEGGKSTVLEFSSHLDLGLPVPKMLMDGVTSKKMEKRLSHIKQMAERTHASIAEKSASTVQ